jgi:phosphate-selective porin OprO/OprP
MLNSSRFITFMERAMPVNAFAPERHLGVKMDYYQPNWSIMGGAFGRSLEDADPASEGDQELDISGRVTFDPIHDETRLVHLGVSGYYRNPSDQSVRFRDRPESHVTGVRFADTGTIANVDHLYVVNPELALVWGPASFQGEYFYVPVTRTQPSGITTSPSVDLSGWYAQVSYFLTGEMRNYEADAAKFERTKVLKPLGKDGGWGAFELGARVSNLDLDDGPNFQKGNETDYTFGLNWYPMDHVRFMANYIVVQNNASALGNAANLLPGQASAGYDDPQIFELRAMVDW